MSAEDIVRHLNMASETAKGMEAENIALKDEIKRLNAKYNELTAESQRVIARLTKERNSMAMIADKAGLI